MISRVTSYPGSSAGFMYLLWAFISFLFHLHHLFKRFLAKHASTRPQIAESETTIHLHSRDGTDPFSFLHVDVTIPSFATD